MKILMVSSSARKKGNTQTILSMLKESLEKAMERKYEILETEEIRLNDLTIATCKGCRNCFQFSEERCPLKDDLLPLMEKIKEADAIVLASPVYVEDVNGIMKNWIDRMAFNSHRPFLSGKPCLILTTSGSGSSKHSLRTMKMALSSWGGVLVSESTYRMGGLMDRQQAEQRYQSNVDKIANHFISDIERKQISLFTLISFSMQQKYWNLEKNKSAKTDYEYWKSKGWLDSKCHYYSEDKISIWKAWLSRRIASLLALFFF